MNTKQQIPGPGISVFLRQKPCLAFHKYIFHMFPYEMPLIPYQLVDDDSDFSSVLLSWHDWRFSWTQCHSWWNSPKCLSFCFSHVIFMNLSNIFKFHFVFLQQSFFSEDQPWKCQAHETKHLHLSPNFSFWPSLVNFRVMDIYCNASNRVCW